MIRFIFAALLLASCARCAPVNPPDPGPTPVDAAPPVPADILGGAVFDCRSDWVQVETPNVAGEILICLAGEVTSQCLDGMINLAHPDTVGCSARDQTAQACAAVIAGGATPVQDHACTNGNAWIRSERVSFR